MSTLSKRSTVYFEPAIHNALKLKAASCDSSVSELIDEAVRLLMREDQEDLVDRRCTEFAKDFIGLSTKSEKAN